MRRSMLPTLLILLLHAASSSADCKPYYVSHPKRVCVNDGEQESQGPGHILLSATKEECCKTLTPRERRECLKEEVTAEVYPDFEKGRCSSSTLRPAVVHPVCAITDSGATMSIVPLFLRESLPVSSDELCCMRVYGEIGQAAIDRCVSRESRWHYVEGLGCVGGDPLDNPVVYSTAQTVGNVSTCAPTYFPHVPAFMCDTFSCTDPFTNKPGSIHCGSEASDCTNELCCDYAARRLTPPGTLTFPDDFPQSGWTLGYDRSYDESWLVECASGVVQIDLHTMETERKYDFVVGSIILPDGSTVEKVRTSGSYTGHIGRIDYAIDRVAPYTLGSSSLIQYTADSIDASMGFVLDYSCVC